MLEGVIAFYGQTLRRSFDTMSNEIIVIPKLLDILALEGAIVIIDVMGYQRKTRQQIMVVVKHADARLSRT